MNKPRAFICHFSPSLADQVMTLEVYLMEYPDTPPPTTLTQTNKLWLVVLASVCYHLFSVCHHRGWSPSFTEQWQALCLFSLFLLAGHFSPCPFALSLYTESSLPADGQGGLKGSLAFIFVHFMVSYGVSHCLCSWTDPMVNHFNSP